MAHQSGRKLSSVSTPNIIGPRRLEKATGLMPRKEPCQDRDYQGRHNGPERGGRAPMEFGLLKGIKALFDVLVHGFFCLASCFSGILGSRVQYLRYSCALRRMGHERAFYRNELSLGLVLVQLSELLDLVVLAYV